MSTAMSNPIEERVKTLELKVGFLENRKNTPFIQVTMPVILSIFLATSWGNFALSSLDKRIESVEKKVDRLEVRMDKLAARMNKLETKVSNIENILLRIDQRLSKIETRLSI